MTAFPVWLPTMLLLLLTTELGAHPPRHMTREEGSRMRRSATSNDSDATHDVAHTSETSSNTQPSGKPLDDPVTQPSGKPLDDSITQPPADVFGMQGSHFTEHADDTKDQPITSSHMQPTGMNGSSPPPSSAITPEPSAGATGNNPHRGLLTNTSKLTPPPITTGNASNVLKLATTNTTTQTALMPVHTPDSSRAPESQTSHVEISTSTMTSTLPSHDSSTASSRSLVTPVTNNTSSQSLIPPLTNSSSWSPTPPVTSSVYTNMSTANNPDASAAGDATASARTTPGDSGTTANVPTTNATTAGGGLHPEPHPTEVITTPTTTTTSKTLPVTPKRSDCPVFTSSSPRHDKGLVSNCLIAIATLAGLATFFMACSIVLCTRLSAAKQRYRMHRGDTAGGTEMVCISALMPDGDVPSPWHRMPRSNGALIPVADTDSDGGDNLTLNSFLPDGSACDGDHM